MLANYNANEHLNLKKKKKLETNTHVPKKKKRMNEVPTQKYTKNSTHEVINLRVEKKKKTKNLPWLFSNKVVQIVS